MKLWRKKVLSTSLISRVRTLCQMIDWLSGTKARNTWLTRSSKCAEPRSAESASNLRCAASAAKVRPSGIQKRLLRSLLVAIWYCWLSKPKSWVKSASTFRASSGQVKAVLKTSSPKIASTMINLRTILGLKLTNLILPWTFRWRHRSWQALSSLVMVQLSICSSWIRQRDRSYLKKNKKTSVSLQKIWLSAKIRRTNHCTISNSISSNQPFKCQKPTPELMTIYALRTLTIIRWRLRPRTALVSSTSPKDLMLKTTRTHRWIVTRVSRHSIKLSPWPRVLTSISRLILRLKTFTTANLSQRSKAKREITGNL